MACLPKFSVDLSILPEIMELFMESFITANCRNINTLCICRTQWTAGFIVETDLTGVSCDVLKRFMECENMHNIEELSFMRKLGK